MTTKHKHLTRAELYAYRDGQLPAEEAGAARGHLESCRRCAGVFEDLGRVDGAISSLPLERVDESFTEKVMAQVGLSTLNTGLYRFVVYLPSVVGLILVLGVMGGAYLLAGGMGAGGEHTGLAHTGSTFMQTIETSMRALVGWLASLGSSGALAITAFALGLLVLVALGDLLPAGTMRKGRERLRDAPSR
jgi:anti-sigma factor RsiW